MYIKVHFSKMNLLFIYAKPHHIFQADHIRLYKMYRKDVYKILPQNEKQSLAFPL